MVLVWLQLVQCNSLFQFVGTNVVCHCVLCLFLACKDDVKKFAHGKKTLKQRSFVRMCERGVTVDSMCLSTDKRGEVLQGRVNGTKHYQKRLLSEMKFQIVVSDCVTS
jgi:hypothetical protein